jgi:hypothetical protein
MEQTSITHGKTGNVPEKKFRAGAVSATVWQNNLEKDGKTAKYNSVSLERVYKDKSGSWQSTNSFRANDLPKLALVAQKAYEYVVFKASEEA